MRSSYFYSCLFKAQNGGIGGLVVSPEVKKREELRWFPADNVSDCDAEPGLEQVDSRRFSTVKIFLLKVREGKPSLACREDEERFCLCGRVEKKGSTSWRFILTQL